MFTHYKKTVHISKIYGFLKNNLTEAVPGFVERISLNHLQSKSFYSPLDIDKRFTIIHCKYLKS